MASNYQEIAWLYESAPGVITQLPAGVDVKVRADGAMSDSADSPLTTDSDGLIAAGTLSDIAAGTLTHFRVENHGGLAFSVSQVTT